MGTGKKIITLLFITGFMSSGFAGVTAQVFVSFSMPVNLLEETLKESASLGIPALLNGLHNNSMIETTRKILSLSKAVPNLNLQIDPVAFERFGINQVPALVVEKNNTFDVIYGNLRLKEGLARIRNMGETALTTLELREIASE